MSLSFTQKAVILSIIVFLIMACDASLEEPDDPGLREISSEDRTKVAKYLILEKTQFAIWQEETNVALKKTAQKKITTAPKETRESIPTVNKICYWAFKNESEALATGEGVTGNSLNRGENSIVTSSKHAGNMGCPEQVFKTTHWWKPLEQTLYPGFEEPLHVTFKWDLEGSGKCSSLTASGLTYIRIGTTTLKTGQSKIIVSSKPSGFIENKTTWEVPLGKEGDRLTIQAHGSSGSLGGTVTYTYQLVCK